MPWLQNMFAAKSSEPSLNYDNIIRNFGAVLEATATESISNSNLLLLPRNEIANAILKTMEATRDQSTIASLATGYALLGKFMELSPTEQAAVDKWDASINARTSGQTLAELRSEVSLLSTVSDTYLSLLTRTGAQTESLMRDLRERGLA